MNYRAIASYLGLALAMMGIAMIVPLMISLLYGENSETLSYLFSLVIAGFLGGGFYFATQKKNSETEDTGLREMVLFLLGWWLLLPVFGAMPFIIQGMSVLDGWYEGITAVTTTGAWISADGARETYAGMVWRAQLQSMGGLVSLGAAAAVFVRPQFLGVTTVTPPFNLGGDTTYLQTFKRALTTFLPVYVALSLFAAFLISVTSQGSVSAIDALVMGLSFLASGGFVPATGGLDSYSSMVLVTIFLIMILSGINFIMIVRVADRHTRLRDTKELESPLFVIFVIIVGLLYWSSTGSTNWALIFPQMFNAASVLSTNGILIGVQPELVPVLVTAVIGGAAVSTAGGIKILRWIITFRRASQEVWKLIHPMGVQGTSSSNFELAVWIHFIAFTILLATIVLIITLFGYPLELAATAAVAVISNSGPLLSLAPGALVDYDSFNQGLRIFLAFGMVLGRMELVIALALFNKMFWSR